MSRRVFLSHDSGDVEAARTIRLTLEESGFECWMAPDSVTGGRPWPEQIVAAIKACDAMVILVSAASNASTHVSKEVELAVGKNKILLPVRIAEIEPSGNLEYLLALAQWTDAFPGPIDRHLEGIRRRVAEAFDAPAPPRAAPPPSVSRPASKPTWWKPAAALVALAVAAGGLVAGIGLIGSTDESQTTEPVAVEGPTSTTTPAVVIRQFGPVDTPDLDGCVTLGWAVDHAATVTLALPSGGIEEVSPEDSRKVCGETGDIARLTCEAADGSVSATQYLFEVGLNIEAVETEVRGRMLLVDVITNQAADISVSLIGRASEQTSTGRSVHHLEFADQASGPVEWQVVASRADVSDAVAGGVTLVPYYSMRVSLIEGPRVVATTTTSTTTTTTVSGSPVPTLVVIGTVDLTQIPIFVNPEILQLALGYWYTYSARPVAAYLGRGCESTFVGDSVDHLLVPTEVDGSAEVTIAVDWCPPDGAASGPLPVDPDTGQIITMGPGFDAISSETVLSFPMNDGAVEIRVLVERTITEDPPY